ncbi:tRNA lysidine(34) synthetase TilS [Falsirhodobacter halotolerans]|uniref:tRNA lysidine(34) synthetase TilS n=1 Tax=Falsirhodobacter halotolerans TaxID=1146892 RepID=UPI001FD194F5|nr:tRNA lysidine(34) synthetase TilS [Falsirhodobacter halotolerans]MCJ8138661.1 tRNA lysidine(34) synthetase TilS [Falsirhodobacter halotolerans]
MTTRRLFQGPDPAPPVLGLAISGGGDSVAMLVLAVDAGLTCRAATVNHHLRPEAAAEAETVARLCARLSVPHDILHWHWDGHGNLSDAARRGRRAVLADWAGRAGVGTVALGHTRDDVAETFLMRLARGAGLDGLAAMRADWTEGGIRWCRPLLGAGRAELRDILRARDLGWAEDPSNTDPRYDRARARAALDALPLGLTADRLADVAGHLAEARRALEAAVTEAARHRLQVQGGDVLLRPDGADPEILRRLVLRAMDWVAGPAYPPRGAALRRAMARLAAGQPTALRGCGMVAQDGHWRVFREASALRGLCAPVGAVWDRWHVTGGSAGESVRALGPDGLRQCPDWRKMEMPRRSLLAAPSVWQNDRLVAAPLAGIASAHVFRHDPAPEALTMSHGASALSH